jgi:Na+-transporting NADH:ubiquinone oxidoreductase subunit B
VLQFQKQAMMRRVLAALAPLLAFSVWLYGAKALLVLAVSLGSGILVEWLSERKRSGKVSEAALVTCTLYALALPPRTPLWIVALGIVFALSMAKGVYGGFGRNVFNPAIAGRLFVYIAFATVLNLGFTGVGGFGQGAVDVLASATPLALMRASHSGHGVLVLDLLFGTRPGSIGESPVILIALAGIYLVATKTASWRIILADLVVGGALAAGLYYGGVKGALPPESLLAGSYLFVAVFMATDPVTAPKKPLSQFIYGALVGATIVVIRSFSAFPEGTSFGVLLGNTFASFIDEVVSKAQAPRAAAREAAK